MNRRPVPGHAPKAGSPARPHGKLLPGTGLLRVAGRSYPRDMANDVIPVKVRGILPANSGCALFIGNDEKVFVIQVEQNMGMVIGMALRGTPKDRPLTHDLMGLVFQGFGIELERVVITALKHSTFFARLILRQQNELGTKLVEIDARPSDCLALASALKRPIFVTRSLFREVEDMSEHLAGAGEAGESDDEPEDGEPSQQA